MTPELFRILAILIGSVFGVLLTVIGTLILTWLKGLKEDARKDRKAINEDLKEIKETVQNHWTKILEVSERLSRIEGWLEPKHGGGKL